MKNFGSIHEKITSILHGGDYNPDQWLHMPEIFPEDVRMMKLAHCNVVAIGIFSWTALEPKEGEFNFSWLDDVMNSMAENNIHVILATPTGAKPAWMAKKYEEVLRVDDTGMRMKYGERHNHCPSSPIYRQKATIINTELANRYKNHPALVMWHISNEFEGYCYCEKCQENFRNWLKIKYENDLDALNKAWWSSFWSHIITDWEEIEAPSSIGESNLHGLNLDWRRFMTAQMVDYCKHEIDTVKSITPDIPVTTNFHDFVNNLDFDYWKFAEILDVISWDNYPYWHSGDDVNEGSRRGFIHDMNRSFLDGKPFMMMESSPSSTNWQPVAKLRRPGMHRVQSLQAVAHGSDTVQYFQWRKSRGSSEKFHGAVVDHCGHENTRVFREVSHLGQSLKMLDEVVGTSVKAEVAVIYDWENAWAIRDAQGPRKDKKDYFDTCHSHYKTFWENSVPVDIINEDKDFLKYKVIVAPMLYMIRDGVGERLTEFVEKGGTLITTYWSGIVNQNDLCHLGGFPGTIKEATGIWAEELDALYDGETIDVKLNCSSPICLDKTYKAEVFCDVIHCENAKTLGTYSDDFYKGMPALTYNKFGKGGAYYIAFRSGDDFLQDFYKEVISSLNLTKATSIQLPKGVVAQTRYDQENTFIFLTNFKGKAREIHLEKGKYKDLDTGKNVTKLTLNPYDVAILKKEEM